MLSVKEETQNIKTRSSNIRLSLNRDKYSNLTMSFKSKSKIIIKLLFKVNFRELYNLFLAYLTMKRQPLKIKSSPLFLQVETTNKCNFVCKMCYVNRERKNENKKNLSVKNFKYILKRFPFAKVIILHGAGEPLINPSLIEMIRIAKKRELITGFFSNGSLLNKKIANDIICLNLDWITFSVDSISKEMYEFIREKGNFDILIDNMKYLLNLRNKLRKKTEINVLMVLMSYNIKELPKLLQFFNDLRVDKVAVQRVHLTGDDLKRFSKFLVTDKDLIKKIRLESERKANQIRTKLVFQSYFLERNQKRRCDWPWVGPFITVEGFVTPCCVLSDYRIINFGNLFEEEFSEIWNNKKYQNFRKRLKSSKRPKECFSCPYYSKTVF